MKTKFYILLFISAIVLSCGEQFDGRSYRPIEDEEEEEDNRPGKDPVEVFTDPGFSLGFRVSPLTPDEANQGIGFDQTIDFEIEGSEGYWTISQWGSKYDILEDGIKTREPDGSITWKNEQKFVTRSPEGYLTLDVTTSKDYDKPRTSGDDPWVHWIIGQDFSKPINLGDAKNLYFKLSFQVNHCDMKMTDDEYDSSMHAAHNPYFFSIRNVNPDSGDHNSWMWVGVSSFDNRFEALTDQFNFMWDIGTNTWIGNMPENKLWPADADFEIGKRYTTLEGLDLKPLFKELLENMQLRGNWMDTDIEDLELQGMNFGWEVPGTFDCGFTIYELSLQHVEYADSEE